MNSITPSRIVLIGAFVVFLVVAGITLGQGMRPAKTLAPSPAPTTVPGEETTLKGKVVCLPHKDTSGPQTLECAIGLQLEDGSYYGLQDLSQQSVMSTDMAGGKTVTIKGVVVTPDPKQNYAIVGTLTKAELVK
jgi:hypothetical protein